MYNMNDMINEMKSLRGADVRIFGQPVTLSNECDELTVDIVDVLEALKDYEMTELSEYRYDEEAEEDYEYDAFEECKDADDALDVLVSLGYIKDDCDYKGDNSYNWGANINHDFDIKIYNDMVGGGQFVFFKCHRYGDVRGNYTEEVILHFDNDYEFYETLKDCSKYVTVEVDGKTYDCNISCTCDWIDVYCEDDDTQFEVYSTDIEELKNDIREKRA